MPSPAAWDLDLRPPDVALLIVLEEEFRELAALRRAIWQPRANPLGGYDYSWIEPKSGYHCVATFGGRMGQEEAVHYASRLLDLQPAVLINIGIAAGLHPDVRIGDVVVPDLVVAYDKTSKIRDGQDDDGAWRIEQRADAFRATHRLVEQIKHLSLAHEAAHTKWSEGGTSRLAALHDRNQVALDALQARREPVLGPTPRIHVETLASGHAVVASRVFAERLRATNADLKALEMEAAGMLLAAEKRISTIERLVIRGISDHVAIDKAHTEAIEGGALRTLAMCNALGVFEMLMDCDVLPRAITKSSSRKVLSEDLRELEEEKVRRAQAGEDVREIQQAIIETRRHMRDGIPLHPGEVLGGRFRLDAIAGIGGFAAVWRAWDKENKVNVAVKVLHSQHATDQSRIDRFFAGARQMAKLRHPGIVEVVQQGSEDRGHHYFVMAWMPGSDLHRAIRHDRITTSDALRALGRVGEAITFAHGHGIIHRDIKPHNILLDGSGDAVLTDFDLVHADDSTHGTRTTGMGTFKYASPEMLDDASRVTPRADVYGFGMTVLYCLLRKDPPPMVARLQPQVLDKLGCMTGLARAIRRAVAYELDERASDCRELAAALARPGSDTNDAISVPEEQVWPPPVLHIGGRVANVVLELEPEIAAHPPIESKRSNISAHLMFALLWLPALAIGTYLWVYLSGFLIHWPYGYDILAVTLALTFPEFMLVLLGLRATRDRRAQRSTAEFMAHLARQDEAMNHVDDGSRLDRQQLLRETLDHHATMPSGLLRAPWYIVLGRPRSGKTCALRNSGLRFSTTSNPLGYVEGVGGLRHCQLWFAPDAVFVEVESIGDQDAWLRWQELLRLAKHPLRGIIVTVGADELLEPVDDDFWTSTHARLASVTGGLPIHMLVTKCDVVAGFIEVFSRMSDDGRRAAIGMQVTEGQIQQALARLERNFGATALMAADSMKGTARVRACMFGHEVGILCDTLAQIVATLDPGSRKHLDGIYLSSALQVPNDGGTHEERPVTGFSYFLADFFANPPGAPKHAPLLILQKPFVVRTLAGNVMICTAILTTGAVLAMQENQALLSEVDAAGEKVAEHQADEAATIISLERIEPLYDIEEKLRGFETDSTPVKLRWGMYQGDTLYPQTETTFGEVGRDELIRPLAAERADALRRFVARYQNPEDEPPADEYLENFESLRFYLLVSGRISDYRTNLSGEKLFDADRKENEWLIDYVARNWARLLMVTADEDKAAMKSIATAWVRVLRDRGDELEIEVDDALVKQAQEVLKRGDQTEAWLAEIIVESGKTETVRDIGLRDIVTTSFFKNDDVRVRGAFTRAGWEKYARGYLSRPPGDFVGSEWVLGLTDEQAAKRQITQRLKLRSRYFEQYIQEWNTFVSKIYIDTPDTLVDSLKMFQDLSRGASPPLKALLTYVAYNIVVEEEKLEPGEKPWFHTENLPPAVKDTMAKERAFENLDVLKHFEYFISFGVPPTPPPGEAPPPASALEVDAYQEQLQLVRDAMQAAVDDPAELAALGKRLKSSTTVVKGQVGGQHVEWRARFDAILLPPFDAARGVVEGAEASDIHLSWCEQVYVPWQERVASMYPFNPKGYDMPLWEFNNWFKPDAGPVWEYFKLALNSRIVKDGDVFNIAPVGSSTITYNRRLPPFLTDVGDIGSVIYPPGGDKPKFEFEVQIDGTPGVSEITLAVDGDKVTYRSGPQKWTRMTWPGEGDPGAVISAMASGGPSDEIRKVGEWGLWRLLGEATVTGSAGQQVYTIKWDLSDQGIGVITIRLKPVRIETPLFGVPSRGSKEYLGLFSGLEVPRSVVSGRACEAKPQR